MNNRTAKLIIFFMAWGFLAVLLWRWSPANGIVHAIFRPLTRLASSRLPSPHANETDASTQSQKMVERVEIARLKAAERRLKQLETDLDLPLSSEWRIIQASVTARDPMAWDMGFRIGKGRRHGVRQGAAVVSGGAVVGIVTGVTKYSSRVRTLLATDSRLGIKMAVSGNVGILKGKDRESTLCLADYLDRDLACEIGEPVVTSGLSDIIPGGLPVGVLVPWSGEEVTHVVNSIHARARVRVAGIRKDFRYVQVVGNPFTRGTARE